MLDEGKQVSLTNYVMVDNDPLGRSNELSEFEKDIIHKFIKTITIEEITNTLPENTKQATLQDPNFIKVKDKTLQIEDGDIELEPINSNFFYDSVKVLITQNEKTVTLLLKISLDPDNKKLSRERDALRSVSSLLAPSIISYRNDESAGIEFLCTSWENGQNFKTFGLSDLEFNFGTFACVLDSVHESDTENITSFLENFEENESIVETFEDIDERELVMFEKLTDLTPDDLENIFKKIKDDYLSQYTEEIPVLSHGNVLKSNVLYQSEYIKLINFENSHTSDIYYSLLKVVNNLSLYKNLSSVKRFLTKYHQHSNLVKHMTLSEFLKKYEEKRKVNKILFFHETLSKLIFHFAAYGAFARKEKLEHYMNLYLNVKPTLEEIFPQYISSFDKLFFTSMPTIKTYDVEELKIISEMYQ